VRDWLAANWDQEESEQPPSLPAEIVEQTSERYRALVERLTLGL
jgi:phosphoribosylaminoimidazole-succinocarboxamide synthase